MDQQNAEDSGRVKCPFCAELIRSEAKICRYCQREVPASTPQIVVTKEKEAKPLASIIVSSPQPKKPVKPSPDYDKLTKESWDALRKGARLGWRYLAGFAVAVILASFFNWQLGQSIGPLLVLLSSLFWLSSVVVPWRFKLIAGLMGLYMLCLSLAVFSLKPAAEREREQRKLEAHRQQEEVQSQVQAEQAAKIQAADAAYEKQKEASAAAAEKQKKADEYAKQHEHVIYPGDTCVVKGKAIIADTVDDCREAIKAAQTGDEDGWQELIIQGKLTALDAGTKVLVLDDKLDWSTMSNSMKVRVITGDCAHSAGWILNTAKLKPVSRGAVYNAGLSID